MSTALFALAAVAAAAPDSAAFSQQSAILVSARAPITAEELGGSVSLLSQADLDRLQTPLLADALRLLPGVTISQNGGPGGLATIRLRGAEGDHTMVVIDGVKVADVASPAGAYDFAGLAASGIGRVEVLRGPQSLAWGSQAIGGVIAVETLDPRDQPLLAARVEAGSRNSFLGTADGALDFGALAVGLSGNWQNSDGISAFSEDRGGLERDDFESWGGAARADLRLGAGFSLDARGRFQQSDFGVDGFPPPSFGLADTPDRGFNRDLSGSIGLRYTADALRLRAGWQAADNRRRSYTPGNSPETSFRSNGQLERLDFRAEWDAGDDFSVSAGVERELTRIATASPSSWNPDPADARARSTLTGGFLQAVVRPLAGLTLLGGLRQDDHSRFGSVTTLAASGSYQFAGSHRVRAAWGEGFKAPTLYQLFSEYGNERLRPEQADSWEVGGDLVLVGGDLTASATWFSRRVRNQIDFISCFGVSDPICTDRPWGTYDNIARTRAKGLELRLGLAPTQGLTVDVNYSWVKAENRSEGANFGNMLARRPEHSLALIFDQQFAGGFALGATVSHVSSSFDDAANRNRLQGYVLVDLRGSIPITSALALTAKFTNLTDERYETVRLYGRPGRQAFVGLRAAL